MPLRKLFSVAALLALTGGCYVRFGPGLPAIRGERLHGAADLRVAYDREGETIDPLCHILFVPQWDVPRGGYGTGMDTVGSVKRYELEYSYFTASGSDIDAQPVALLDRKIVEAGGRRFDLAAGNVFVAAVRADGSVRVSQLPSIEEERSTADIVAHVKAAMPHDARVQALHVSG